MNVQTKSHHLHTFVRHFYIILHTASFRSTCLVSVQILCLLCTLNSKQTTNGRVGRLALDQLTTAAKFDSFHNVMLMLVLLLLAVMVVAVEFEL